MTGAAENNLEKALSELTRWQGGKTELWKTALKSRGATTHAKRFAWLRSPLAVACTLFGVLFLGSGLAVLFQTQAEYEIVRAARSRPHVAYDSVTTPQADAWDIVRSNNATPKDFICPSTTDVPDPESRRLASLGYASGQTAGERKLTADAAPSSTGGWPELSATRQVIRKATMRLKSKDVRAAFLQVQHLVRAADGEFVSDSMLSGEGNAANANLTLRVAAGRLSEVMNRIRDIAHVEQEHNEGQDVTSRIVDLEARLRNLRSLETELLELLQERENPPLADILKVREELNRVRGEIERLVAQREHLGNLVSLATVLVIIRAENAIEPPSESLGDHVAKVIADAWTGGVHFLIDTVAMMVRVLIGGLAFWVLIAVAILVIRRVVRKSSPD